MNRSALAVSLTALISSTALAAPPRGAQAMRSTSTTAEGATPNAVVQGCNTPQLDYNNGPVIQNVKVFDVMYNAGNPYKTMLEGFYKAITASAYFDWLVEYNAGTYKIGRGSFLGTFEDMNSATTTKTLPDSGTTSVQSYLKGLISAGKVPKPDDNTIYMIYFPSTVTITLQGSSSCSTFCAYHSSMTVNNQLVRYGVMPDVTQGACAQGCGPNSGFQNITDVSSHELIEAVTDPDNGTGWYDNVDNNCGEIGDICATNAGETGTVATYTVQKEWSNKLKDCIVINPAISVNDFTVAATPTMVNVPVGGMATAMVTLTKTAGMSESATLTATAPAMSNVTAALSPTSAMSDNGTSTLTLSAASTATVGTMGKVTVKAAGSSATPTVDVSFVVVDAPDMAQPPSSGGNGGTGGGGSGGNGTGGNGSNQLHDSSSGCSVGGAGIGGAWAVAGLFLLALALRRRRA